MPRVTVHIAAALIVMAAVAPPAVGATPDWFQAVVASAGPDTGTAETLLRDVAVRVEPDGRCVSRHRIVTRIPNRAAAAEASVVVPYVSGRSKVRSLRAWRANRDGTVDEIRQDRTVDVATDAGSLYSEDRSMVLDVSRDLEGGGIVGFEYVEDAPGSFATTVQPLQSRLATRWSRVSLVLPPGWRFTATGLHWNLSAESHSGDTLAWSASPLPAIPDEPFSIPWVDQVPAVVLRWVPPAPVEGVEDFADWPAVARWFAALSRPASDPDDGVRERARAVAAAETDDVARARSIARFVQGVRYVSIQIGDGRYQPHAAAEVLRDAYGDCKDKASLARAMLSSLGIRSWLVLVHASDPWGVAAGWPSPLQFNHCIVAIALPQTGQFAAGLRHPSLGPLLFFDPTDPATPFGELPENEQGGLALIAAADLGGEIRLPSSPPGKDGVDREVSITLGSDRAAQVRMRQDSRGADASRERAARDASAPGAYEQQLRQWCLALVPGSTITGLTVHDAPDSGAFHLTLEARQSPFGRPLPDGSISAAPIVFGRVATRIDSAGDRRTAVRVPRWNKHERLVIELPAGYGAEDLPSDVTIANIAGSFALHCEQTTGRLVCDSRLELRAGQLPPERFADLAAILRGAASAARSSFIITPPSPR